MTASFGYSVTKNPLGDGTWERHHSPLAANILSALSGSSHTYILILVHFSNILACIYFVLKGIDVVKSSPMILQKTKNLICIFIQQEEEISCPQPEECSLFNWVLL